MNSNNLLQITKPISVARVEEIFKKNFFLQPIFIQDLPSQKLQVSIKNESDVEIISQEMGKNNKEATTQKEVIFYPFLLQTEQQTLIVIGSTFSLYERISREPYLETKAEYQFQQQLRKALKLTGGFVYHLPGDSSDFVTNDIHLEDVSSQELELRYEHDDIYSYLFVLI